MRQKLLFLGAPFEVYKGGSELQYSELETVLREKFDIYYLFRHPRKLNVPRYITYDYTVRRQYRRYNYSDAWKIYTLMRRIAPDLIYKRGADYIFGVGVLYARRNNAKFIWHIAHEHDVLPYTFRMNRNNWRDCIDKAIIKSAIHRADVIVGQAHYQDILLKTWFGRPCNFVLPNLHRIPVKLPSKRTDQIQIVWIANLKRWKRPDIFIRLAQELGGSQCKFIMAGRPATGLWQKSLEKQMAAVKHLEYLGEIERAEVDALLGESHIFVNTSEKEGFPNSFIEAWLRQVVPVSAYVNPDGVFTRYKVGVVSNSPDNLVEDVRSLLLDSERRNEIALAGYRYAVKKHTLENNKEALQRIFQV